MSTGTRTSVICGLHVDWRAARPAHGRNPALFARRAFSGGASDSVSRSAVVLTPRFTPNPMTDAVRRAAAANHSPTTGLPVMSFNMGSTLLWVAPEWMARRSAPGTVRGPALATERYLWCVESRRHDPRRVAIAFPVESLNGDEDV